MKALLIFLRKATAQLSLVLGCCGLFQTASAAIIPVAAGAHLQSIIDHASAGDELHLAAGEYTGNIKINKPLKLIGPANRQAIINGQRRSKTVWVNAPNVTIRQLTITLSGMNLPDMDSGIFLDKTANNALIENNTIRDNAFGVYIWGAPHAIVRHNRIIGNTQLRVNERGNGVSVWNAPGAQVIGNNISEGRDGIFSNTSTNNIFKNNYFHHLRYAVHYMYTNDSEVSNNISDGNQIGYAIMYSKDLKVKNNIALNSSKQGMMLNYTNDSIITGNAVEQADKCLFLYNASNNIIQNNHLSHCTIGIHATAASDHNLFNQNAFINNQTQVKYVGTRYIEWSDGKHGNYWSDNSAFDLNGDGIADTAYRPNGLIDQIVWRAPIARLLINSPAVSIVKWAQTQFPAILPGGITDSKPLMLPPITPAYQQLQRYKAKK